ncbi:nose resistant to fluoxetine protein 6-like [Eupeodes corollae]|uniref:nose resistant to fluoxetine protein 6-like n=1 Tax=Eupeodes corollae TaxID=290404 RepID=UPI00249328B0|nr:nose resistant to fluoxetine protein 6-like [Eupeodes corollae]
MLCVKLRSNILLLINGINSLTVINNVTVSGDFLSDVFVEEITNNKDLLESPRITSKQYDSRKCVLEVRELINRLPSLKVLPFFDSWGKLPSGILYGSTHSAGNFDQCTKTSISLYDAKPSENVNGQFCFVNIPIIPEKTRQLPIFIDLEGQQEFTGRVTIRKTGLELRIGICVPESCSAEFLTTIFQQAVSKVSKGKLDNVSVSQCTNGKPRDLTATDIFGIAVFSTFGALMLASTLYDYFTAYYQKTPIPVLLAFSILTNGKKLFAINLKSSPNSIDCLTGIRVLTMVWIIFCHTYMTTMNVPIINQKEQLPWVKSFWSMPLLNGTISVDSFFFISGLLVAWLGFRELDKTNGKLNVIMMYVHRYLRLTPAVAAVLLFMLSINKLILIGPFKQGIYVKNQCDGYNWWPVLLYIPNYLQQKPRCFDSTWYLDVDFQLYIISPLLLIAMWRWGKKFAPVLLVLSLLSIGSVIATYASNGFTGLINGTNDEEWTKTYSLTHTRCSPWFVGFACGYFMHINRNRKFQLSALSKLLGWTVCIGMFLVIVYGPYFTIHDRTHGTVLEAALYEGLKRFSWAVALCWLTVACHFGFGGLINSFLSHPYWQPLGRLSYSLYLVHLTVIKLNFGIIRSEMYFSDYYMMLQFWSAFGVAIFFALALSLAFESPILVLEKFIFGGGNKAKKAPQEPTTTVSNQIVDDELPKKTNVC